MVTAREKGRGLCGGEIGEKVGPPGKTTRSARSEMDGGM